MLPGVLFISLAITNLGFFCNSILMADRSPFSAALNMSWACTADVEETKKQRTKALLIFILMLLSENSPDEKNFCNHSILKFIILYGNKNVMTIGFGARIHCGLDIASVGNHIISM
ncbi:hypothetical protein ES703_119981 [subsurface metagenome]